MTMTAEDFKAALTRLELKTEDAGRVLQIARTTAFRYASGRLPVPRKVELALIGLEAQQARGFAPMRLVVSDMHEATPASAKKLDRLEAAFQKSETDRHALIEENRNLRERLLTAERALRQAYAAALRGDIEVAQGILARRLDDPEI